MELNTIMNLENNINNYDIESKDKEVVIKKKYNYNKKIELVKKINKIKKKEYLLNIFKIIKTHSENYTENNNGVFIFFHNLDDKVYEQIEIYVNQIYKMHKKSSNILNVCNSDFSDSLKFNSDITDDCKELSG